MKDELSHEMRTALSSYGVPQSRLEKYSMKSDLVHDLGIVGDDFWELVPHLEEAYGKTINFSHDLVPSELSGSAFWVTMSWMFPPLKKLSAAKPVTLSNIDFMIKNN